MEIQKQRSEIRRKRLEKRVKMASGKGTKGSRMKSPKPKQEKEDDNFLEDLVVDSDPKKPATYSTLKTGGFVTKAEDLKRTIGKKTGENGNG